MVKGTKWAAVILCVMTVVLVVGASRSRSSEAKTAAPLVMANQQALGDMVLKLIGIVQPKMSLARKQILARTFVRVASDVLQDEEQGRYFAILVAIESRFTADVVSPAGAMGMAQLMPSTAREFGKLCGVTGFDNEDLKDTELNLTIGACVFRTLVTSYKGNLASALVAYNAGGASLSLKQLHSLANIANTETASYVAKFMYLNEAFNKTKM